MRNRREDEEHRPYFVDRVPKLTFLLAVLLLILTIVDGVITLVLLDANCEEVNPVMSYLLSRGPLTFLFGKYLLTATFLPVMFVLSRCTMFGTKLRVGVLLPVFVTLYLILIGYQFELLREGGVL